MNHFFTFDQKSYEQCDSVGVGFTLRPILADVFMCHFESIWLENCPSHFKPIIYRRFTDDILSLFEQRIMLKSLKNLNKHRKNIEVTSKI